MANISSLNPVKQLQNTFSEVAHSVEANAEGMLKALLGDAAVFALSVTTGAAISESFDRLTSTAKPGNSSPFSGIARLFRAEPTADRPVEPVAIGAAKLQMNNAPLVESARNAGRLINLHNLLINEGAEWYTAVESPAERFRLLKELTLHENYTDAKSGIKIERFSNPVDFVEITHIESGEKISYSPAMIEPTYDLVQELYAESMGKWKQIGKMEWKGEPKIHPTKGSYMGSISKLRGIGDAVAISSVAYDWIAYPTAEESKAFLEQAYRDANPFSNEGKSAPESEFKYLNSTIKGSMHVMDKLTPYKFKEMEKAKWMGFKPPMTSPTETLSLSTWKELRPVDGSAAPKVAKAVKAGQAKIAKAKEKAPAEKVK